MVNAKEIPQERIETMARPLLAVIRSFFEDPKNATEYDAWLAARRAAKKGITR